MTFQVAAQGSISLPGYADYADGGSQACPECLVTPGTVTMTWSLSWNANGVFTSETLPRVFFPTGATVTEVLLRSVTGYGYIYSAIDLQHDSSPKPLPLNGAIANYWNGDPAGGIWELDPVFSVIAGPGEASFEVEVGYEVLSPGVPPPPDTFSLVFYSGASAVVGGDPVDFAFGVIENSFYSGGPMDIRLANCTLATSPTITECPAGATWSIRPDGFGPAGNTTVYLEMSPGSIPAGAYNLDVEATARSSGESHHLYIQWQVATLSCAAGSSQCGSVCVPTIEYSSSIQNCGGCRHACSGVPGGIPVCISGQCGVVCDTGLSFCSGACKSLASDVLNCGGCGEVCSSNHVTPVCASGRCDAGVCDTGFADCNGNKLLDGCETNILSDVNNCGTCGNRCLGSYGAPASCVLGRCGNPVFCPAGMRCCDPGVSACRKCVSSSQVCP